MSLYTVATYSQHSVASNIFASRTVFAVLRPISVALSRHQFWAVCDPIIGPVAAECIDRESCDTRVKGHPKEFHVNRRSRKEFQKIVPICLYMVCKHWSKRLCCPKTRKLGMWRSNVIHLRGYYDIDDEEELYYAIDQSALTSGVATLSINTPKTLKEHSG